MTLIQAREACTLDAKCVGFSYPSVHWFREPDARMPTWLVGMEEVRDANVPEWLLENNPDGYRLLWPDVQDPYRRSPSHVAPTPGKDPLSVDWIDGDLSWTSHLKPSLLPAVKAGETHKWPWEEMMERFGNEEVRMEEWAHKRAQTLVADVDSALEKVTNGTPQAELLHWMKKLAHAQLEEIYLEEDAPTNASMTRPKSMANASKDTQADGVDTSKDGQGQANGVSTDRASMARPKSMVDVGKEREADEGEADEGGAGADEGEANEGERKIWRRQLKVSLNDAAGYVCTARATQRVCLKDGFESVWTEDCGIKVLTSAFETVTGLAVGSGVTDCVFKGKCGKPWVDPIAQGQNQCRNAGKGLAVMQM